MVQFTARCRLRNSSRLWSTFLGQFHSQETQGARKNMPPCYHVFWRKKICIFAVSQCFTRQKCYIRSILSQKSVGQSRQLVRHSAVSGMISAAVVLGTFLLVQLSRCSAGRRANCRRVLVFRAPDVISAASLFGKCSCRVPTLLSQDRNLLNVPFLPHIIKLFSTVNPPIRPSYGACESLRIYVNVYVKY